MENNYINPAWIEQLNPNDRMKVMMAMANKNDKLGGVPHSSAGFLEMKGQKPSSRKRNSRGSRAVNTSVSKLSRAVDDVGSSAQSSFLPSQKGQKSSGKRRGSRKITPHL
jgi:hypothetical protein